MMTTARLKKRTKNCLTTGIAFWSGMCFQRISWCTFPCIHLKMFSVFLRWAIAFHLIEVPPEKLIPKRQLGLISKGYKTHAYLMFQMRHSRYVHTWKEIGSMKWLLHNHFWGWLWIPDLTLKMTLVQILRNAVTLQTTSVR